MGLGRPATRAASSSPSRLHPSAEPVLGVELLVAVVKRELDVASGPMPSALASRFRRFTTGAGRKPQVRTVAMSARKAVEMGRPRLRRNASSSLRMRA